MNRESDNLERYISANRKRFDRYTPPDSLRRRVFRSSRDGRRFIVRRQLMMAASLLLLAAIPSLFIAGNRMAVLKSPSISGSSPELTEVKIYYEDMMASVFSKAGDLFTAYPGLENEVKADLDELDEIGSDLLNDLKDNIDNREVVEALIRNYRIRIQLLEDLLSSLEGEEKESEKPKSHEI
jgi:hypothetical protein